ncbi:MAG: Gfo/Idh/MocA family oxidoreductase [Verrucomicrobia bacterium]|nr:Gfo/Idh/MocA family oxidoreductase [Verrucomicrobiota bacterium]
MTTKNKVSRRQFLKGATAVTIAAPTILPSHIWAAKNGAQPNERITLGFIGLGYQARSHLKSFLGNDQTQVLAICEVDTERREHAIGLAEKHYSQERFKDIYKAVKGYNDFRELLARKDIDAVVIATPDHWHAIPVVAAAQAGKDIYCEKPLSLTIYEAKKMMDVVQSSNIVFQTGSQQRSSSEFLKACELVRNGKIGEVKEVYVAVGGPSKPCDLPTQTPPEGLDWDMWLGPAPWRGYHEILSPRGVHSHFPNWRSYKEYSGGGMTDWGAHHFDIAQWGLGMDNSGPVEIYPPDGKDHKMLTYKYDNGVMMYHGGEGGVRFVGTKGKVYVDRGRFQTWPESIGKEEIGEDGVQLYESRNHRYNWLECIRNRKQTICPVEVGARSVTVCHLGNLAYWHKRPLKWDPENWRFVNDPEADTWMDRKKRSPWKL